MQRLGFANGPALGSSRLQTGNDGDGFCRPRSVGVGCEHLHLRPRRTGEIPNFTYLTLIRAAFNLNGSSAAGIIFDPTWH